MTDPTNISTFTPVQTVNVTSTAYNNFEVPFTSYSDTGAYIAIKAPKPTSGYNYGYVDNIIVDLAPLCAKPMNVLASNITADGADIDWIPGGSETDWEIVVVPQGMSITTGTPEPVSAHPYTLTNLNNNTAYDVYVRADCGTGTDYSSWSQVCHFSTTPLCSAPTNVEVSQIAGSSALLTWTEAVFGATGYTVAYTETGQNNWNTQSVTGNSYMLTGLTPLTPYTVTITSECNEGTAPVITRNFTTGCLFGGDNIVGNGTSTSYNIPLNTFYNYSYVQQLYLASEINNSGDIHSIGFQYIYSTAQTKNNQYIYLLLGPDTGVDSIGDPSPLKELVGFLNALAETNELPKTILYSLNPTENAAIGTVIGCFQGPEARGKIQHGSAWWFNDHEKGMLDQMTTLASEGALAAFVGMLTDSRSFLSYARHEYFRRLLCNLVGNWVEKGEYPNDEKALRTIVEGICYNNAKAYFGF